MKGQSKALELVIVLFVLVVVAWVIITLFQSLINQQSQKLENIQTEEELKGKLGELIRICENRCNNYKKSRSQKDLIDFCSESFNIDLNKDGEIGYADKSPYPEVSLGGIGVCEDKIPCFAVIECKVGEKIIDAKTCEENICGYFDEVVPLEKDVRELRLNEMLDPGKCYKTTQPYHWFNIYFNGTEKGKLKCENG